MAHRTVLATIAGSEPHQRLQVALTQGGDGRLAIDLRDQHYAEGIGWFDQRTLALSPQQFRQLQAVLGLQAATIAEAEQEAPAILPFPGPRGARPPRPAVGDGC